MVARGRVRARIRRAFVPRNRATDYITHVTNVELEQRWINSPSSSAVHVAINAARSRGDRLSSKPRKFIPATKQPRSGRVCVSMARENIKYVKWIWFGVVGNRWKYRGRDGINRISDHARSNGVVLERNRYIVISYSLNSFLFIRVINVMMFERFFFFF